MLVFAQNYRGFKNVCVDLEKVTFLVGDNSSGKTSILHLVDCVLRSNLGSVPVLNDGLGVSAFDYFSPYFGYADVTFGFFDQSAGVSYAKLLTVKRRVGEIPKITRCSVFSDGMFITLKREASGMSIRVSKEYGDFDPISALSYHNMNSGFSRKHAVPKAVSIADASAIFFLMTAEDREKELLFERFFRDDLPTPRMVSPIRALPERFYSSSRKISPLGSHFAAMWHDYADSQHSDIFKKAELFGQESKLFDRVKVRHVSKKIADSPLFVTVEKHGQELFLNQVGVGVSQVVPVIIEIIYSLSHSQALPVLLQQPELHLHPIAQAAFGSFLHKAASRGLRGIVETHSSFLIDRFRAELRDKGTVETEQGSLGASDVMILFCENEETGNIVHKVSINDNGALTGEPSAYHSFFVDELMRTMF